MEVSLRRTPLYPIYQDFGAKTIDFGGWELPVQFSSIKEEHEAIRTRVGLFDVSHMGEIEVNGTEATHYLQKMMTNDMERLQPGKALYTLMCYPDGGTVDDLLVYMLDEHHYMLVVNAANIGKDMEWLQKHIEGDVQVRSISDELALLATQGPLSKALLQSLTETDLGQFSFMSFQDEVHIAGISVLLSRTGYTGEDGFELYVHSKNAITLWQAIMSAGEAFDILPCGLGARDTLRFEACLPLYGQELGPSISPLEVGLGFAVKVNKEQEFIGQDVLREQKEKGVPRRLVGIEMIERGIPRHGYPIFIDDVQIGEVTTGTQSPTLKQSIGLALISAGFTELDRVLEVEIRNKKVKARVVQTPFYKRKGVKKNDI
jgi:aminomethyltransferase